MSLYKRFPIRDDGTPKNNFELWLEWIDKDGKKFGDKHYSSSAWWAGWMETIRVDATSKVDIGYYSFREIDPTKPLTDRSNPKHQRIEKRKKVALAQNK